MSAPKTTIGLPFTPEEFLERRAAEFQAELTEKSLAAILAELERKSKDLRAWEVDARTLRAALERAEAALEMYADPACCDGDLNHEEKCKVGVELVAIRAALGPSRGES